jgi:hypothetical protein
VLAALSLGTYALHGEKSTAACGYRDGRNTTAAQSPCDTIIRLTPSSEMREDRAPHSGRTINRILCNDLLASFFMLTPNDYRGKPLNGRQGQPFVEWDCQGYTVIKPLPFLHGRKWDDIALAYVHALRPSHLRVVQGGAQCDAQTWRVTVWLKDDGETIASIDQEVAVGLPSGIEHGHALECALRG